jgi:hypothetical protein
VALVANLVVFVLVSLVTKPVDAALLEPFFGIVYGRRHRIAAPAR